MLYSVSHKILLYPPPPKILPNICHCPNGTLIIRHNKSIIFWKKNDKISYILDNNYYLAEQKKKFFFFFSPIDLMFRKIINQQQNMIIRIKSDQDDQIIRFVNLKLGLFKNIFHRFKSIFKYKETK
jgi:hypothetical protein